MLNKLEIYLAIFASLVSAIVSIVQEVTLFEMAVRLIIIIIMFYIIGFFVKLYLRKKVFPEPEIPEEEPLPEDEASITNQIMDSANDD